jgi:DNA repair protein RecO (recombination protein O)
MKYNKLTGIILKKQNYREADQIVTLWTREAGKIRVMARGLRLGKSKLSFGMQDLGVVEIETAGHRALPALISTKPIQNFSGLREDLSKTVAAFYAVELMLKMTPDEEPNAEAYGFLLDYLNFLNSTDIVSLPVFSIVDSFSLRLLRSLGFSIEHAQDTFNMPPSLRDSITLLVECRFPELPQMGIDEQAAKKSHEIVKNFIEFILERNIKSDQFLASV